MKPFLMPSLGADMEDGTLVEQLIATGEPVARGDIIAAVETQKGTIEIEAFDDGILDKWLVPLGTKVPVGTPIATIRASDTPDPTPQPDMPQPVDPEPQPISPEAPQPVDPDTVPQVPEDPQPIPMPAPDFPDEVRQRVTPAARRRAAQTGFDLKALGTEKIITLDDVTPPEAETPVDTSMDTKIDRSADTLVEKSPPPLTAMRQAIADAMSRSKREIPHYYLSDSIDLTAAEAFIADHNATLPPDQRLLIGVLYLRAIARAVAQFPEFNGTFADGRFTPSPKPHVGMAINLRGGGLVAPALNDVDQGDLDDLMARLRDLVDRVRQGRFRARELSDSTITLTSLGDRGVAGITGVIFPPQVAIIGIGTPGWTPIVRDGQVLPCRTAAITLAADHRVSDGHRGAGCLRAVISHLQTPEAL